MNLKLPITSRPWVQSWSLLAAASFMPCFAILKRLWLNIQKVPHLRYCAQIILSSFPKRKLWRKGCWQKACTFQHFCPLLMTDPDLTLQASCWWCSLHKAVQWNTPSIFGFMKINHKLPSVNMNRNGGKDSVQCLRTYTTLGICLFSIFIDDNLTTWTSAKCVFNPSTEPGL